MKTILFLCLTFVLVGGGCTPYSDTYYFIDNRTDKDMVITEHSILFDLVVTHLSKDTTILYLAYEDDVGDGPAVVPFTAADSVVCEFPSGKKIVFYPDYSPLKSGKNLYNINDYQGGKDGRRTHKFTFVFEEDEFTGTDVNLLKLVNL